MYTSKFLTFAYLAYTAWGKAAELNKDTFETFIKENEKSLVKFYAPWCGHCKKMAPEFDAAADILAGTASLAKVNVDEEQNKPLATEFGIRGFPTLKFFDHGKAIEYTGGREKNDIVNWVKQMTGPAVENVESRESAFKLAEAGNVLTYCGDQGPKSGEFSLFKSTAEGNRGLVTFVSYPCEKSEQPTLELIRSDGTSTKHKITATNQEAEIIQFVKGESLPYFGAIGPENAADYASSGLDVVYFGGSVADYEAVKDQVLAVSKAFRGVFAFTFLDSEKYSRQAEGMLRTTTFPSFVLPVGNGKKGTFKVENKDNFNSEFLTNWVKQIKAGEIQPELQSEEMPETNDEPVKVLVGKNFDSIVTDDKDVMVEIYAPWCGHCKQLAPEYTTAATTLQASAPDVVLGMIDGTANDISNEAYNFTGFPTIYWKKAGAKPVKYEGGRTAVDIVEFIATNGTKPFEVAKEDSKDEL